MKYNLVQKQQQRITQTDGAIYFISYIDNKRFKVGLGLSVPFKGWDKKKQKLF